MKRLHTQSSPTSDTVASAILIDGYTTEHSDQLGGKYAFTRNYSATGIISTTTDPRGNTTTSKSDIAGRNIEQIDAAGNSSSISYFRDSDQVSIVTDALGNSANYIYDIRNRKVAEYGTGIQPSIYCYDDANRMLAFSTFRVDSGDITSDPTGRSDGDTTSYSYHATTGSLTATTYPDGSQEIRRYNANNTLKHLINARGIVAKHSYDSFTGKLKSVIYSDSTPDKNYSYNQLGQVTSINDASGTHDFTYNEYSQVLNSRQQVNNTDFTVMEQYDELGRSAGYRHKEGNNSIQVISQSYDTKGRIASASFMENGINKDFHYNYLEGTSLLQTLTHPNGISTERIYEPYRNLLTDINDMHGAREVSLRGYSYDAINRPETRKIRRKGGLRDDNFAYNFRSELITSNHGTANFAYDYDNIGNRKSAQEIANEVTYSANASNQYTAVGDFTPEFDADGNQTKLQTSTGIWRVIYNAENRPVTFRSEDSKTLIEFAYDFMGRCAWKKVTENGIITKNERYLYRGYLQIAAIDLRHSDLPTLHLLIWDPTEAEATRPLALQAYGTWFSYGLDLSKNVKELFNASGTIETTYDYLPFGEVSVLGAYRSPLQWSSEVHDDELGLVYYNYRHYNPTDGRWINRDPIGIEGGLNLYSFVGNRVWISDMLGLMVSITPDDAGLYYLYRTNPIKGRKMPRSKAFPAGAFIGAYYDTEELIVGLADRLYAKIIGELDIPNKAANGKDHSISTVVKDAVMGLKDAIPKGFIFTDVDTVNAYDFLDVQFAIGSATVATRSRVRMDWCKDSESKTSYTWNADMSIYFFDVFEQPYYTKGMGSKKENGNPFGIHHYWPNALKKVGADQV